MPCGWPSTSGPAGRMTGGVLATLAVRYLLVMLFFPFSALDKIINFHGAVGRRGRSRRRASPRR